MEALLRPIDTCPLEAIERAILSVAYDMARRRKPPPRIPWPGVCSSILLEALVEATLGSRVRAQTVASAMTRIAHAGLLNWGRVRTLGAVSWAASLESALVGAKHRYPFSRSRAQYLRRTLEMFDEDPERLAIMVDDSADSCEARRRLVRSVCGFGPKQASFFLRQIGYPHWVAILDVHVMSYMRTAGLCDDVAAPRTMKRYEELEVRLLGYAEGRGFPISTLDSAIWITMQAVREAA